ncbi:hypothetical protein PPYR_07204 [Photinus pyralis]|uniref:Uncharacterized protein n=1 Tax=Photinus pyralis TaxID=7054 RepID=A0A5N4APS8_PHOPY|nr:uncharacterized protein LOC116169395 [Photinus pyralis]KAB0799324.1 hypothetical protein PPYR_07204 [Photinus pyralis]
MAMKVSSRTLLLIEKSQVRQNSDKVTMSSDVKDFEEEFQAEADISSIYGNSYITQKTIVNQLHLEIDVLERMLKRKKKQVLREENVLSTYKKMYNSIVPNKRKKRDCVYQHFDCLNCSDKV